MADLRQTGARTGAFLTIETSGYTAPRALHRREVELRIGSDERKALATIDLKSKCLEVALGVCRVAAGIVLLVSGHTEAGMFVLGAAGAAGTGAVKGRLTSPR
jgi:hypothetical protein